MNASKIVRWENGCPNHTTDLKAITTQADILVSTIRRPGVITADMLHPGAVVVDLGDNMEETREQVVYPQL